MKRVAIIGLGLIGGSLGLALKKARGSDLRIVGYNRSSPAAALAQRLGAIDEIASTPREAAAGADMVVLATPALAIRKLLAEIAPVLSPGAVVTDTASTKEKVMAWGRELLPGSFVGGHPMAGKELVGITAAEADLFQGAIYCITPGWEARPEAVDEVKRMAESLRAWPLFIDARTHDRLVAGISHLPLVLSSALVSATTGSEEWPEMAILAAGGYLGLTRLASGSPEMSRDIAITNRESLLEWLDRYMEELRTWRQRIKEGGMGLGEAFHAARKAREEWLKKRRR